MSNEDPNQDLKEEIRTFVQFPIEVILMSFMALAISAGALLFFQPVEWWWVPIGGILFLCYLTRILAVERRNNIDEVARFIRNLERRQRSK